MDDLDPLASDDGAARIPMSCRAGPVPIYEATVPDTLDLAERGRLGINHFTSIIREERDY